MPGAQGRRTLLPRVVGPIRRTAPVEVRGLQFLRANTSRRTKITLPGPFSMSVQARDDFYNDPRACALAYAEAVNAEVRELFAAGADVVQLDEPWFRNAPERAREFGVEVVNRALDGATGTTAVHMCFGYAALMGGKPSNRYAYLEELADANVQQISVEAAQPKLDLAPLKTLADAGKTIILGTLDLGDPEVESAEVVAERIRAALSRAASAAGDSARLRHEVPAAPRGVRQAEGDGGRRRAGAKRATALAQPDVGPDEAFVHRVVKALNVASSAACAARPWR